MIKLAYFTSTRADFGIMARLLQKIKDHGGFDLSIIVTGTHLEASQGYTVQEIKQIGLEDQHIFEMPIDLSDNSKQGICRATGQVHQNMSPLLELVKPQFMMLLGDRFEALAAATVAVQYQIPLIHFHGGELTYGANDDVFRHAITKMSYLHFVATPSYRQRVIQMGEDPNRVFHVGALGVENAILSELIHKDELFGLLGLPLDRPVCLMAYHPETAVATDLDQQGQLDCILEIAASTSKWATVVFTKANVDHGGKGINDAFTCLADTNPHIRVFSSLGQIKFMSLVSHCAVVVGNSSAGIIEVPSLGVASISIGSRQGGRDHSSQVYFTGYDVDQNVNLIESLVNQGKTEAYNPYGCPLKGITTSDLILQTLETEMNRYLQSPQYKAFYDLKHE